MKLVTEQSDLLTSYIRAIAEGRNINLVELRSDLISIRGTLESCEGNVKYMKESVVKQLQKTAEFIKDLKE